MLTVRDGNKALAAREVTLASDGQVQNETLLLMPGLLDRNLFNSRSIRFRGRKTAPITASPAS